jgi:succinate dehydrogenase/fumarate reductase cytochrome b subunit (b558 family)
MSPFSKENLPFFWRRLHSLTGTVPLGAFLFVHLWTNSKAVQGERGAIDAWPETSSAFLLVFEIVALYLPLAFHALYGFALVLGAAPRANDDRATSSARLDRASSVVVLAFVAYHLLEFRIPVALGTMSRGDYFAALCNTLSSTTYLGIPLSASLYLIGLAATSYHFAHGLWAFPSTWGIPLTERLRGWSLGASVAVGVGVFLLGASTVLYFATGSKMPGI